MNSIKQTLFLAALTYTIVASALPPPRKAGTAGSTLRQSTETKTHYLVNVNKGEPLGYTAVMLAYKGNTPGGAALVRKCAQAAVATPAFAGKTVALIPLASSFELEPSPESAPSRLAAACEACAKEHGLDWAVVPPATLARNRAVGKASVLDDAAKREHLKDIYVVPDHKLGLIRALEGKVALLVEDDEFTGASLDAAQMGLEDAMTRAGVNFDIERVVMARHKSYVQTSTMAELDAPTQTLFQDVAFGIFADADVDVVDGANIGVIYYFLIGGRVYIGSHIASKRLYALGGRFLDAAANDEEEDASAIAFEIAKERVKEHAQQALKGEHNTKVRPAVSHIASRARYARPFAGYRGARGGRRRLGHHGRGQLRRAGRHRRHRRPDARLHQAEAPLPRAALPEPALRRHARAAGPARLGRAGLRPAQRPRVGGLRPLRRLRQGPARRVQAQAPHQLRARPASANFARARCANSLSSQVSVRERAKETHKKTWAAKSEKEIAPTRVRTPRARRRRRMRRPHARRARLSRARARAWATSTRP
jgi:hypothetical protein